MENTATKVYNTPEKNTETERLELARELGLKVQEDVHRGKTRWQIIDKQKEWIWFEGGEDLAQYLWKKHKLFKSGFGIFSRGDYLKMRTYSHEIERYPQRLPMGVLIKYKEAKESGIFRGFYVIDPDLKAEKVDPFLIGTSSPLMFNDERCALICSWLDKTI